MSCFPWFFAVVTWLSMAVDLLAGIMVSIAISGWCVCLIECFLFAFWGMNACENPIIGMLILTVPSFIVVIQLQMSHVLTHFVQGLIHELGSKFGRDKVVSRVLLF